MTRFFNIFGQVFEGCSVLQIRLHLVWQKNTKAKNWVGISSLEAIVSIFWAVSIEPNCLAL